MEQLDSTFVTAIAALVRDGEAQRHVVTVDGIDYWSDTRAAVIKPAARALAASTLTAVADYLRANPDGLDLDDALVTVDGPAAVTVSGALRPATRDREHYLTAVPLLPKFTFGTYYTQEAFLIALACCFAESEERLALGSMVGHLAAEQSLRLEDDGLTQHVATKAGVARLATVQVPPIIPLTPYRTFQEVAQVTSRFLVRIGSGEQGPTIALFEADGGAWQVEAHRRVAEWLLNHLAADVAIAILS